MLTDAELDATGAGDVADELGVAVDGIVVGVVDGADEREVGGVRVATAEGAVDEGITTVAPAGAVPGAGAGRTRK